MAQQNEANPVPPAITAGEASGAPMVETGGYVWPTPIVATDRNSYFESVKQLPVTDCFREVDASSWIIAGHLLLKHFPEATSSLPGISWSAAKFWSGYYTLENAPRPLPKTYPMGTMGERDRFIIMYNHADARVVFYIGAALLKASIVDYRLAHATREYATLAWLNERKEFFSFEFPEALAHYEFDGRAFLFLTAFNRMTMGAGWDMMMEPETRAAADRIAAICHELAAFKKTEGLPSGVDGRGLYLAPEFEKLGMDCSDLVFAHNDLSLGNVLLDDNYAVAAIIDWETAGFVPREWVRTKGMVSRAYLRAPDYVDLLSEALQERGYPEVAAKYNARLAERRQG
ncbi:hypothetical protein RB595_003840 [Gaeumannomyces hyphopodioides]